MHGVCILFVYTSLTLLSPQKLQWQGDIFTTGSE